jgi:hypothetical protein
MNATSPGPPPNGAISATLDIGCPHRLQALCLSKAEMGRAFERLVQLYLQTEPEYRTILRSSTVFSRARHKAVMPGATVELIPAQASLVHRIWWRNPQRQTALKCRQCQ